MMTPSVTQIYFHVLVTEIRELSLKDFLLSNESKEVQDSSNTAIGLLL